ncbi:MAG: hypothetical protein EPO68_15145 [Planctomycetota bacterium]|nr:MAG: hypothetical protein EPO68_15145 [Planctomycetota bacterium]
MPVKNGSLASVGCARAMAGIATSANGRRWVRRMEPSTVGAARRIGRTNFGLASVALRELSAQELCDRHLASVVEVDLVGIAGERRARCDRLDELLGRLHLVAGGLELPAQVRGRLGRVVHGAVADELGALELLDRCDQARDRLVFGAGRLLARAQREHREVLADEVVHELVEPQHVVLAVEAKLRRRALSHRARVEHRELAVDAQRRARLTSGDVVDREREPSLRSQYDGRAPLLDRQLERQAFDRRCRRWRRRRGAARTRDERRDARRDQHEQRPHAFILLRLTATARRATLRRMTSPRTPPRLPRYDDDHAPERVRERRELVERALGLALPHAGGAPVPTATARGKIENQIGYAQLPLGLAGPLLVDTSAGVRDVYVPLATTEGALVASYSRGMRLLRAAGPARARVVKDGLSQHPVLVYDTLESAQRALALVAGMRARFDALVAGITKHGKLLAVEPDLLGARLVLRLVFATGDAIGINMAAHAAELCSAELARASGARERYVHGQDVEKRSNARALVEGRGRSVVCEARIPRAALAELARVEPEQILACWRTYAAGYAQLGTHNWTVQAANGLAAIFIACGQDAAYLTESATGWLDFEVLAGDLVARVHLPSLLVGTVGGGTGQGTAAECLDVLGVRGDGGAVVFAELIAAAVLAGDLSLLAAFCAHEFVAAHERLGRNRPA